MLKSRNNISNILSPRETNLDVTDASRIIDSHRPLMTPRAQEKDKSKRKEEELKQSMLKKAPSRKKLTLSSSK